MISASAKINVIPARAVLDVDCRVPPGHGKERALARVHELLGEDGYEVTFHEPVTGNRSPIDTPLMDSIRAFVEREDPGAEVAPFMMPGFSDSRWFRDAFPDCVAYGFFPQNTMDVFESTSLMHGVDERVPVADLGLAASFYADLAVETLR
jgi:acetylornithine deacetylase/succinyl-diaminopimelate desuccinylase-like protein